MAQSESVLLTQAILLKRANILAGKHTCGQTYLRANILAGKHTYGVDYWWCGTLQRAIRGLELGVLGIIDVTARSAFALQATQTPSVQTLQAQGKSLMEHYVSLLEQQRQRLECVCKVLWKG